MAMEYGTVSSFNDDAGYGFIRRDGGGDDVFVHYTAIDSEAKRRKLLNGQRVAFEAGAGPKGLRATWVRVV